eukprot:g10498.t1
MPAPDVASAAEASAAERRAAEVSVDISRHLARVAVADASFSSSDSNISSGECDSTNSLDDEENPVPSSSNNADVADTTAGVAEEAKAEAAPAMAAGRRIGSGGGRGGEFFVEPEWQRVPGRWAKFEDKLLREMKAELDEDLRAAPPFPEVIGSRRMLRFLRGHKHDAPKAAAIMRKMLRWRKDNNVDAIREDIMQNQKFHPSQFPDGEMITKLFPLLVANPLCVDMDGAPISYESYEFSPRQVTAHANGDLGFFIKFHIYCQEFKQICLDSLSDAKEMENLARRAADRSTSPSPPPPPPTTTPRDPKAGNSNTSTGGQKPGRSGAGLSEKNGERGAGGSVNGCDRSAGGSVNGCDRSASPGEVNRQAHPAAGTSGAEGMLDGGGATGEGAEEGEREEGEEEEPWGVVLRNTIIRDLAGFGMEHAGPIGRSLISQVLAVSQDNYPEMMEKCYIINAPWVFYALWKGLTPLVSANTAKKVQVLKYDFLTNLCETISLERLPLSAGGGCNPAQVTSNQMLDFVVCGRVAEVPGGAGTDEEDSTGGGGTDDESGEAITPAAEADPEVAFSGGDVLQSSVNGRAADGGALAAADTTIARSNGGGGGGGGRRRSSSRRSSGTSSIGGGGGGGGGGRGSGKPHVTFRSLFERLQARDKPSSTAAVKRQHQQRRPASPPLSRASSFQDHSSVSVSSPPLSRQGSNASLISSSGRPFASPGPRGIRRLGTAGVGIDEASDGERSPGQEDEHAEDFDSQLVDRALRLSMKRKAQRYKTGDVNLDDVDVDGSGDSSASPSPSPPLMGPASGGRLPEEHEREGKGGWAKKKWRALRERRESKKMLEKGFLADLPGLSAGDCAEWIPNSARNSCLHCERSFTILLRRHHCRMCGEVVCAHCSPHRVRLAEDDETNNRDNEESAADGSSDAGGGGGGGGGGGDGVSSSHRWHGNGGESRRSRRARKEKEGAPPRPLAVRVCTDCYFSLQTVTVASASAVVNRGSGGGSGGASSGGRNGGRNSGGGDNSGGNSGGNSGDDESLPGTVGDGGGGVAGAAEVMPEVGLDVDSSGSGSVGVSGAGDIGVGLSFGQSLDAVCCTEEIAGDVVLGDVLEWGRIQRRASKCVGVVRMCLLVVVELHHNKVLETALRAWRVSSAAISSTVKHATAALASSTEPSSSSSSDHVRGISSSGGSSGGSASGNSNSGGDGATSASTAPGQASLRSSNNGHGDRGDSSGAGGEDPSSLTIGSPLSSASRAAGGASEPHARSSEGVVVARAEAAVWAIVDKAAAFRYSALVVFVAMLSLICKLW